MTVETATRKKRQSSRPAVDTCTTCFYCDMPVTAVHEHDHFPVPHSIGGDQTVTTCLNCHSLRDRVDFDTWPGKGGKEIMLGMLPKLAPVERILITKLFAVTLQALWRNGHT